MLVYEYLPFCSSESGRSPEEVRTKCGELHLECVVISSVYDGVLPMSKYKFPVFVIDKAPYNTDNYQDYSNEFYKALTHGDDEDLATGSFHYFSKGKYVYRYASVSDITL